MPKLPTFTASSGQGVVSGGRRATAEDMGAVDLSASVHAVQRAGEGFIQAKEDDESRKVLVSQAEIRAKYAKRLDDAVISGEDTDKIKEELNNDLSTVSEGLVTRKGADTAALHAANTGAIFDNQASQIQVTRAVVQAKVDGAKFINGLANQVSRDPSSLKSNEESVNAFVATLTRIPAEKRVAFATEWRQDLNVAAALAMARVDPEGAKKAVQEGQFDLTVPQREHIINRADETTRAIRTDKMYERQEADYQKREKDLEARDEYFKQIMRGGFSMQKALDDPRLSPQSREHLALMQEARGKAFAGQERKSDQKVKRDLWLRINAPDGTPGKIYTTDAIFEAVKAQSEGKPGLSTADADQLNGMVANQKDENNRGFSTRLNGRMQLVVGAMRSSPEYSNQPELAAAVQIEMMTQVEKKAQELRKAGKSPDDLLNPESKDYFFKPNVIKTLASDVKAQQKAQLPKVVSPEDYAALPVGAQYVDSNGNVAVKKAQRK